MNWSSLLKHRRESCELTQTELAVRAGVSLPSIQNMEAGRANPALKTLIKVFDAVGVDIEFCVRDSLPSLDSTNSPPPSSEPEKEKADSAEAAVEPEIVDSPSKEMTESDIASLGDLADPNDLWQIFKDVTAELSDLTKGSALERAGKLVKLFERVTTDRQKKD